MVTYIAFSWHDVNTAVDHVLSRSNCCVYQSELGLGRPQYVNCRVRHSWNAGLHTLNVMIHSSPHEAKGSLSFVRPALHGTSDGPVQQRST
jgi:hypothetical protein